MVLLQDHYKTHRLRDGQGELITTILDVMQVLLTAIGNVKDLDINL